MGIDSTQLLLCRIKTEPSTSAWQAFQARYSSLIIRYCRRCGLQLSDAEDIQQVVMFKLSKTLASFRNMDRRGAFRNYLRKIVHSAIVDWSLDADRQRQSTSAAIERISGCSTDAPDEAWDEEWMSHHYRTALQTIRNTSDPRNLQIFHQLLSGRSVDQVATSFSLNAQAVYKIKQRLRDRLKHIIAMQIESENAADLPAWLPTVQP